jgi:hypothetical protein
VLGFFCRHGFGGWGWVADVGLVVWFYVAGMWIWWLGWWFGRCGFGGLALCCRRGFGGWVLLPVSGSLSLIRTSTSIHGRGASELPWPWVNILIVFFFFLFFFYGYEKVMEFGVEDL